MAVDKARRLGNFDSLTEQQIEELLKQLNLLIDKVQELEDRIVVLEGS